MDLEPAILANMQEVLLDNISHNRHSIGIFLDLSKAFDVIDHKILLLSYPILAFEALSSIGTIYRIIDIILLITVVNPVIK